MFGIVQFFCTSSNMNVVEPKGKTANFELDFPSKFSSSTSNFQTSNSLLNFQHGSSMSHQCNICKPLWTSCVVQLPPISRLSYIRRALSSAFMWESHPICNHKSDRHKSEIQSLVNPVSYSSTDTHWFLSIHLKLCRRSFLNPSR